MAGRYRNDNSVARHPNYDVGAESRAANTELHEQQAKDLMPRGMSKDAQRVWKRVAPELCAASRLKSLYVDFIAEYCIVKARLDALREELDKTDWVYKTDGRHGMQLKSRPQVAQLNDDWRKWNSLVAQLGLSPATELRFNDRQGSLFDDDEFGKI